MLEEYRDFLLMTGFFFLQAGISIYIKTQAQVYIWGRMLKILNTNRSRNTLALLTTVFFTVCYIYSINTENRIFYFIWEFLNWFSMAIIIYVLLGFRLYSRIDSLLDKKVGKDKKGV